MRLLQVVIPGTATKGVTTRNVECNATPCRFYLPEGARESAALLWIHGGGHVIGSAKQDDWLCGLVARRLRVPVLSVDYSLSPEAPFPTALDQSHAAWCWLLARCDELGIDPGRIAIGGESAGGGIAACLVQKIRDHGPGECAAQWLFAPMLDDRTGSDPGDGGAQRLVWTEANNRAGWRAYLGSGPALPSPRYAAAAREADLGRLPPAWIGVGDIDLFNAECRKYHQRLSDAGCDAAFVEVPGAPHGFQSWARKARVSREFVDSACEWLGRSLGCTIRDD